MLNPALSTENVVDAGRHLVPLIVVSKSRKGELKTIFFLPVPLNLQSLLLIDMHIGVYSLCLCVYPVLE